MTALDEISSRTAWAAVLASPDLDAARAVAEDELARLDALAAGESDLLEPIEAAKIFGKSPSTMRRWVTERGFGRKIGIHSFVSRSRVLTFLERGRT